MPAQKYTAIYEDLKKKDRRGPLCGYEVPVSGMPSGEILICNYAGAGERGVLKPFEA